MSSNLIKYPRTQHVRGSRFQHGDDDMESVPWSDLRGKRLVLEEKMDGSNVGISFDDDGKLQLQSRGHYLRGGPRELQYALLKQWVSSIQDELYCTITDRYIVYGEWMYAKHTVFYDALPHYFMEFDVYDKHEDVYLSTERRIELLKDCKITPVLVTASRHFQNLSELSSLITHSNFITDDRDANLTDAALNAGVLPIEAVRHTDMHPEMEGLYIKWEEDGVVKGRYKYVRDTFTSSIMDQETHWHDRPIIQNKLSSGALERMFS